MAEDVSDGGEKELRNSAAGLNAAAPAASLALLSPCALLLPIEMPRLVLFVGCSSAPEESGRAAAELLLADASRTRRKGFLTPAGKLAVRCVC